jgi:hypothetical protein
VGAEKCERIGACGGDGLKPVSTATAFCLHLCLRTTHEHQEGSKFGLRMRGLWTEIRDEWYGVK